MSAEFPIHVPHQLHAADRRYRETNCYTDVLIELIHSRRLEPLAGLGHLVRTDFEGDQFTFFKMPQGDIELLYGIDIHEMQPVGALDRQIEQQLAHGRTMLVELNSFYLPDTAATDYRRNHVKSTIAAKAIDSDSNVLQYFHNTGLFTLSGEDYRGAFGLDGRPPQMLPPYLEVARFDAGDPLTGDDLLCAARDLLRHHLSKRPVANPFKRFKTQLEQDLPRLLEGDSKAFHAYAFATVRMAGAAFDLLSAHVAWLLGPEAARGLDPIIEACQVLSFRLARRKAFDPTPSIQTMAEGWSAAMMGLERAID